MAAQEIGLLSKILKALNLSAPAIVKPQEDLQITGSIASTGILLKQNISGWNSFILDYSASGVASHTLVVEGNSTGLDNDQWFPISGYPIDVANTGAIASRTFTGGNYYSYIYAKRHPWIRIRISAYGGTGTINALVTLSNTSTWMGPYQLTLAANVNNNNAAQASPYGVLVAGMTRGKNKVDDTASSAYCVPGFSQGGQLVTQPYSVTSATWNYVPPVGGITNSNVAVLAKAADSALKHHITQLVLSTDTLGGATDFVILDGTTVLERIHLTAPALQPTVINFVNPLVGTVNTAINIKTETAVTGGVYASLRGYLSV